MRRNQLIGLAAVAVVVVGGAAYSVYQRDAPAPMAGSESKTLLPGLAARVNEVTTVRLTTADKSWTIARAEDGWRLPERYDYPADASRVKQLIVALAAMKPIEAKTANPELYARIGVQAVEQKESKAVLVELLTDEGRGSPIARLLVGDVKSAPTTRNPGQVYVRRPDEARAWLVEGRFDVKKEPLGWLDNNLPKIAKDQMERVEIRHPDGEVVKLKRVGDSDDKFEIEGLPEGYKVRSEWRLGSIAGAFEFIDIEDVAPFGEKDFAAAVQSTFETDGGMVIEARLRHAEDEWWLHAKARADQAAADPEKAKADVETFNERFADWAYRVSSYRGENFARRFDDLAEEVEKEKKDDASGS